jgi:hypothetical protein
MELAYADAFDKPVFILLHHITRTPISGLHTRK